MDSIEVMLWRWSDGPNGMTVTFQLDPNLPDHPFKGVPWGKGGQRFAMALAKIADDETVEEKTAGEKAVIRAGILCKDPEFQRWLMSLSEGIWVLPEESSAAHFLYKHCEILSRRELAFDPDALGKFNELVQKYMDYKQYGTI